MLISLTFLHNFAQFKLPLALTDQRVLASQYPPKDPINKTNEIRSLQIFNILNNLEEKTLYLFNQRQISVLQGKKSIYCKVRFM